MYLSIDGWSSGITFSACHVIPGHEKCGRLHGHTYAIHARIYGSQNRDMIIMDFLQIKSVLRSISESLDHKVILPEKSSLMTVDVGKEVEVKFAKKHYVFPKEDVVLLNIENAAVEELARYVLSRVLKSIRLPENVSGIEIGVDEGKGQTAWTDRKSR